MSTRFLIAVELTLIAAATILVVLISGVLEWGGSAPATRDSDAAAATAASGEPVAFISDLAASPSALPTVAADACGPPVTADFFTRNQVLSYYGNPYTADMGILGELEPEELV